MSQVPFPSMDELLQRLLDGQAQPEEMQRLQKAVREDVRVRDYYVDSMLACAVIRRSSQVTGELGETDLVRALAGTAKANDSGRIVHRLHWIAAVLVFGLLTFASVSLVRHVVRGPALGTLTGGYEAQWRRAHPHSGEPIHGRSYDLVDGVAKMQLGHGTTLLLEAPCEIELISMDEVNLKSGRLVVSAPSQASGFRVRTRTALITDLGTEFGVVVHPGGSIEAHVLKGRISVELDPEAASSSALAVVAEGQAGAVDANGETLQTGLSARPDLFVLTLPAPREPVASPRLNLADLVGGGNGRGTGTVDQGIDLGTGQALVDPVTRIRRARQNPFRPTPQWPGIDGVFVPNGAPGPVVISSTGLMFSECPDTQGSYYGGPTNSGKIYDIPGRQVHAARFHGVRLGTSRHPALSLHPNAGVTFDLDQLRRDNPSVPVDRFTAVCGIPKDLPETPFSSADVWVLLDGVVHLHLHYPVERHVLEDIDVPIPADTRFLTLAATCTGRADYSWIFFRDPFLGPATVIEADPSTGQNPAAEANRHSLIGSTR